MELLGIFFDTLGDIGLGFRMRGGRKQRNMFKKIRMENPDCMKTDLCEPCCKRQLGSRNEVAPYERCSPGYCPEVVRRLGK